MASVILLHKAPAIWEVECKGERGTKPRFTSEFEEIEDLDNVERKFINSMKEDLFFLLFYLRHSSVMMIFSLLINLPITLNLMFLLLLLMHKLSP